MPLSRKRKAKRRKKRTRNNQQGMSKTSPSPDRSVPLEAMGVPGQVHHVIVVNHFRNPDDPRNKSGPHGQPGKYKVVLVLSRPGFPLAREGQHAFADKFLGDSHLAITRPAFSTPENEHATSVAINADTPFGRFDFIAYPNTRGFVGKIVIESLEANGFEDAELKGYRIVAPTLSQWSILRDIPIHVFQTDSIELATGNTRMSFDNPHVETTFAVPPRARMTDDFRRYASLYREALNCNTAAYRFLCFYKIIEGIMARRNRLNGEARSRGEEPKRYDERLPADRDACPQWLNAIFYERPNWDAISIGETFTPKLLGKKFTWILDKQLRPLRHNIAHAVLDSGEPPLLADEGEDLQRITRLLPMTRCIARRMLKNEFPEEFLAFVAEDGTVQPS